ncbi:VanZ family protein [Streptomyces cavernae]|uniref:VanZ family protein n=1 Tax=Streptomyces cavernae TaxID=2259034 RepID=UPI000FEB909F|nr:VanZ family protein [Streptomyces cavernae]
MQRQGKSSGSGGNTSAAIRLRVAGAALLVAHLLLVGWITLRPLDVPWVSAPNLRPFAGIRADLAMGPATAARRMGEGLALLAPFGVLLPAVGGRLVTSPIGSLIRTTAAGALLSLAIELLQTGVPGQVVDVDSLMLNTVGVALAHLAVVPAARARLRRRAERAENERRSEAVHREEAAQGPTPTIPRVGIAP